MRTITERQQTAALPLDSAYCQQDNKGQILGIAGAMMTLAIIIVSMRTSVRAFMIKSVGADDYVIQCALVMAIATFICFVGETNYAVGKHKDCIPPQDYERFAKWQYFHSLWVMIGVVLVKISIALFLMRLVPPGKKWKSFLWAAIIFLVCFCLTCMGTLIWSCVPIAASWNFELRAMPTTKCFSNNTFSAIGLMNSAINCTTDFLFAIVPIPIVVKLQVNRRTKVTLACILSLGYFACAAGIIKAVKQHSYFQEPDPLWDDSFNVWNMIELCVGIVAASLPALRPLFAKILQSTKSAFSAHSWPSSGSGSRPRPGGSNGYLRQQSGEGPGFHGDVTLGDWKDVTRSTGTTNSQTKILVEHEARYQGTDMSPRVDKPYD